MPPANHARFKVLHIGKFYPPHKGGMETHLEQLCSLLQKHCDVTVLVANDAGPRVVEGTEELKIIRARTLGAVASTSICPGLVSEIRNAPADIVHLHHPNPTAFLAYMLSGHAGKLVVTYHSDIIRQRILRMAINPLVRHVLRKSAAIIATSPNLINFSAILPAFEDRCTAISLGVDLSRFTNVDTAEVSRLRERYGSRIILGVGRLVYYKGFEYLIRAMKDVPGTLLIVGTGPLEEPLRKQIRDLSLQDRVHLLGEVPDMAPYYHAADIFVLSSVHPSEAFGLVQVEAMACGKPVINTDLLSGAPFVSKDGVTGITVPPGDSSALAAAMSALLENDALRAQYGAAAKVRAFSEFTVERMVDQTVSLYRRILGEKY